MKLLNVVAAIIQQDGMILATQRGYGDFAGGWEFPGGKIEAGETPGQAVVREVAEELAVTVAVDELLTVVDYDYEAFHLRMHCFLSHVESGELRLLEHRAARWLDADTIDDVEWLPADIQVIKVLRERGVVR